MDEINDDIQNIKKTTERAIISSIPPDRYLIMSILRDICTILQAIDKKVDNS